MVNPQFRCPYGCGSKPCTPVVHIKIAGKWMFIPLKMVLMVLIINCHSHDIPMMFIPLKMVLIGITRTFGMSMLPGVPACCPTGPHHRKHRAASAGNSRPGTQHPRCQTQPAGAQPGEPKREQSDTAI